MLFSEAFQIHFGFDIRLSYLIILSNLALIIAMYPAIIAINKIHLAVLGFLLATGALSIASGANTMGAFAEQFVGISLSSIYFYLFFKLFADVPIGDMFLAYCRFAYLIIIIGFIKFFITIFVPHNFLRFESIFTEPSHCITVIFPAIFYYLKTGTPFKKIVGLLAIILTFSSVGYLGFMVAILVNSKINFKYILLSFVIAGLAFFIAYKNSDYFSVRVNDTVLALAQADVSKANLSSYALVSNMFVAFKSLAAHPFFGSGLGSHQHSHDLYISKLAGADIFAEFMDINAKDANSLMLRIISDLGIAGVILVLFFIIRNYARNTEMQSLVTKSIFIYFFCKLLREGHYFSPEMYFFVFLYYLNAKAHRAVPQTLTPLQAAIPGN